VSFLLPWATERFRQDRLKILTQGCHLSHAQAPAATKHHYQCYLSEQKGPLSVSGRRKMPLLDLGCAGEPAPAYPWLFYLQPPELVLHLSLYQRQAEEKGDFEGLLARQK